MLPWKCFEYFTAMDILAAMAEAFLKWGAQSNDQISFAYSPYLSCPDVTCPIYVGFRPTVLASGFCITVSASIFLMS